MNNSTFDDIITGKSEIPSTYMGRNENAKLKSLIMEYFRTAKTKDLNIKRFKLISSRVVSQIPNLNTQNVLFINTRKILKERNIDPAIILYYSAGKDAYKQRKENATKSLTDKTPQNITVKDYLALIDKLDKSVNIYDHVLLVIMSTGSRPIEVFEKSKYEKTKYPDWIKVAGFAKIRTSTPHQIVKPILGIDSDRLLEIVEEIRGCKLNLNKSALNNTFEKNNMNAQHARDAYAHVSYELYGDKEKQTLFSWISQVLNHSDATTATAYGRTNIIQ